MNWVIRFGRIFLLAALGTSFGAISLAHAESAKRIVFLAGKPSHGYGAHEHLAGCRILADEIQRSTGGSVVCEVYGNGWPEEDSVLEGADSIVMYCDGGGGHPALPHLDRLSQLLGQGTGFVCLHYAVEVPKERGGAEFLEFLGGYFETHWSVNPHWTADFQSLPEHPVTRGLTPFQAKDEWYFHMRFREAMEGVTPILSAVAPDYTMLRPDGPHSGNPDVRKAVAQGIAQHTAWVFERPDGGRSFGFTGGHFHWNWGRKEMLRLVCNAILWTAKGEVPEQGLPVLKPGMEQLEMGQDFPKPENHQRERVKEEFKLSAAETRALSQPLTLDTPDIRLPDRAIAGLKIHPDLAATLSASEPSLLSPTCIDVDHRGRVWVCEVVNYRGHLGKRPEGDRILIFEDRDGDGVMDSRKVFYQGTDIDSAMGICVLGNQVIVSASPNIWIFTDETGDDRPDRKELLFSNTGQPQHDHSAHSFVFGPDGKLYWNFGNTGQAVHDGLGKPVVDSAGNTVIDNGRPYYGGMVFRCNFDGTGFETLAHNFRNNYELAVDSFGNIWQSDNDDDGNKATRINYVMEFGNYGYRDELTGAGWRVSRVNQEATVPQRHWHLNDPGVVPTLLITGAGSPSGIMHYEGDLLPPPFRNQMIHCEPGRGVVRAYITTAAGAGYSASIVNLVESAEDDWFRPVDACAAPDGSLFIADWYDPGVGGHQMGDLDRGRLYRIAPPGHDYRIAPADCSTTAGAAQALLSPNQATRYLAWQALQQFGNAAQPALEKLCTDSRPWVRARAYWVLGSLPGLGAITVAHALSDDDPQVRCMAVRLARQLEMESSQYFVKVLGDDSPAVLRELSVALHLDNSPEMPSLWAMLASRYDTNDRWMLEALGIGAARRWQECFAAYAERMHSHNRRPESDIVWRARTEAALPIIGDALLRQDLSDLQARRWIRSLDYHDTSARHELMAEVVDRLLNENQWTSTRQFVLAEFLLRLPESRHESKDNQVTQILVDLLNSDLSHSRKLDLLDKFNLEQPARWLLPIATADIPDATAVRAAEMILSRISTEEWLSLLGRPDQQAVRLASAFASARPNVTIRYLERILQTTSLPNEIRVIAAKGMTREIEGASRLAKMVREDLLPRESILVVGSLLRSSQDEKVRAVGAEAFPAPTAVDKQALPELNSLVTMQGNAQRGSVIYQTIGLCAKCHPLGDLSKNIGPNLSEIGSKLAKEALYVSILDPSAGISHSYETFSALTDEGQVITGLKVSQTDGQVVLRDAEGIDHVLLLDRLDDLRQLPQSLMPDNLVELMTVEQLVDLVEYLQSLRSSAP